MFVIKKNLTVDMLFFCKTLLMAVKSIFNSPCSFIEFSPSAVFFLKWSISMIWPCSILYFVKNFDQSFQPKVS